MKLPRIIVLILSFTVIAGLELTAKKKIVLVAGPRSHGVGAHEFRAGTILLEKRLGKIKNIEVKRVEKGWPQDEKIFKNAASIIFFSDGNNRHPLFKNTDKFKKYLGKNTGFGCIHYAVEMAMGAGGEELRDLMGGVYEINYSVNPHWWADFRKFPNHPIMNGVKPFAIGDEWYYNMNFVKGMKNVTPLLSVVPDFKAIDVPDHHHRSNPIARKLVKDGVPQHMAWAYKRPDGGRSFEGD